MFVTSFSTSAMNLTSSTLSLDGFTRVTENVHNFSNEGHESSVDFITKRRKRWTPHKYQSLDNLSARSFEHVRNFGSLEAIQSESCDFYVKPAVWRAYIKFVRGAWRKSRKSLMTQTRRAEELQLRERSSLIQMSSVFALLTKDKVIMKSQTAELGSMTRSVGALENECTTLKEQNFDRRAKVQSIHEEVNRLNELLSNRKRALVTAPKNELAVLERTVAKKCKKHEKFSTEIAMKKLKIEKLKKEIESNDHTVEKMQNDVEKFHVKKHELREKIREAELHFKKIEVLAEKKEDEKFLLSKELSEVREANQKADAEVMSVQTKLLGQDAMVAELERLCKEQSEELEGLRVGLLRNPDSKWDKLICGVWAASCVLQLVTAVDRRWP